MKIFVVNGNKYQSKEFDFNMICDLEDMGITIEEISKKPRAVIRAYFALCAGKGKDFAGKEMEAHLIAGGSLECISDAMSEEMEKSDFFRKLREEAEKKAAEEQGEEKKGK